MQTSNLIIPNKDIREIFKERQLGDGVFGVNILGAKACEIAYTRCAPWLDRLIALIQHNHEVLREYLAVHLPMVRVFDLEGTYLQWLDFRSLGMDKDELEKFMHQKAELYFDEGYIFGEEGAGFERMNLACPTKVLLEALERLVAALKVAGKV